MGHFASTVAYYESARPPYPDALFAKVAGALGLDRSQRLLDVGYGARHSRARIRALLR